MRGRTDKTRETPLALQYVSELNRRLDQPKVLRPTNMAKNVSQACAAASDEADRNRCDEAAQMLRYVHNVTAPAVLVQERAEDMLEAVAAYDPTSPVAVALREVLTGKRAR